MGTAIISLGLAVSLLLNGSDEESVDQMKLIEYLCDIGKLLSDILQQQSNARKSFIAPMMEKGIKLLMESLLPNECL